MVVGTIPILPRLDREVTGAVVVVMGIGEAEERLALTIIMRDMEVVVWDSSLTLRMVQVMVLQWCRRLLRQLRLNIHRMQCPMPTLLLRLVSLDSITSIELSLLPITWHIIISDNTSKQCPMVEQLECYHILSSPLMMLCQVDYRLLLLRTVLIYDIIPIGTIITVVVLPLKTQALTWLLLDRSIWLECRTQLRITYHLQRVVSMPFAFLLRMNRMCFNEYLRLNMPL